MRKAVGQGGPGAKLRTAIRESGLTRYAIAKLGRLEYSAVWRFVEHADCDPTLSTADKIAAALGLTIELRRTRGGKLKA